MCKPGTLCSYSSSALVDSFVLRNPPDAKPENVVFYFWFNETFFIILRLNIKVGGKKKRKRFINENIIK
jgi:hypothetical protein